MSMQDSAHILQEQVLQAASEHKALAICGGGSKKFYGHQVNQERLATTIHSGITEYAPSELVITARGGTPLAEMEQALWENGQMLACEPPHFSASATFGGMLATGLSGPSRPYRASVQDTVLGCTVLNGNGEILRFGGKVMKNVAGYDVSRLMVGSLGCLGIILEATIKVIPATRAETGIAFAISRDKAGAFINDLRREGLPVSASCHDGRILKVRFSAGEKEIAGLPGQLEQHYRFIEWQAVGDNGFWSRLNEHDMAFFNTEKHLWRLSTPSQARFTELPGSEDDLLTEWGGSQHWLKTDADPLKVFERMNQLNGHATLFRAGNKPVASTRFQPLTAMHMEWHRRLKQAFDPAGILNPGRMYTEF